MINSEELDSLCEEIRQEIEYRTNKSNDWWEKHNQLKEIHFNDNTIVKLNDQD